MTPGRHDDLRGGGLYHEPDVLTLADFLADRLDEDEAVARSATPAPWRRMGLRVEGDGWTVCDASSFDALHIERHDPARVLAEVESKRRIVALHAEIVGVPVDGRRDWGGHPDEPWFHVGVVCASCGNYEAGGRRTPCDTLRALALPYAGHPDFREEWRP